MRYNQNILLGAIFIIFAEMFFAAMGASVKALTVSLPLEVAVFFRNFFALLVLFPIILRNGKLSQLKTNVPGLHLIRTLVGLSALYCFFYALTHIPLAEGMILKMTSPIFMPILAFLFIGEIVSRISIIAIPIGFIGVWIILNPNGDFSWAAVIGLVGGVLVASVKVIIRKLSQTESTLCIVFYFTLLATLISAIPLSWSWQTPNTKEWILIIVISAVATAGQLLMTRAYSIAPVSRIGPFSYTAVIYGSLFGYFIWHETLSSRFVVGSAAIILAGSMALYHRKRVNITAETQDPTA